MRRLTLSYYDNRHQRRNPLIRLIIHRKIFLLLSIIALLNSRAMAYSQGLTLSFKDSPLSKVFKEIERQSKFEFIYPSSDLHSKRISISVVNAKIMEVMDKCLADLPFTYYINGNRIVVSKKQSVVSHNANSLPDSLITVHGKIVNDKNEAISGATVSVKGSDNATASTADGSFVLNNIKSNAIIIVSSVGYEPKIVRINSDDRISIQLTVTAQQMKEVVVNTGLETLPRERSTGAFTKVDNETFNRRVGPDIISRLEGVTPGLFFDKRDPRNIKLQIRGLFTLNEQISQPLIVIDNLPYEGNLLDINPNDIQDITILKDAAATSIWGARAGNGVIVITTNRGSYNQMLRLDFNSNVTFVKSPNLFDLSTIPTSDFIDLETYLFNNNLYERDLQNGFLPALTPVVEILLQKKNGEITEEEAAQEIDKLRSIDNRNDFKRYIYQNQLNQQYSLSARGGSSNANYYLSVGYDKNKFALRGNDYNRISVKSTTTFQPHKKIQIRINLNYTNSVENNNSPGEFGDRNYNVYNRNLPLYVKLVDDFGNARAIDTRLRKTYTDTIGGGQLLDWKFRPVEELKYKENENKSQAFLGNIDLKYDIYSGLSIQFLYQYQRLNSTNRDFNSIDAFVTRSLINTFTNLDATDLSQRFPVPLGGIVDLTNRTLIANNGRAQINFNKSFNTKHRIAILAGGELRNVHDISNSSRSYGYTDNLSVTQVDYTHMYTTRPSGDPDYIPRPAGAPFMEGYDRFVSYFGNASYSYDNRYTVTLSARKDASNIFGVKTNEKGRPFWSVGGAWSVSNEKFYGFDLIPNLRLRLTYGYSGNIDPSVTALTIIRMNSASQNELTGLPYATLRTPPNPNLRWEKVGTLNLGVDFGFINDRLNGSLEFYKKNSSDVINGTSKDPTTGITIMPTNSADMTGGGIELTLNYKPNIHPDIKWNIGYSFTYTSYKVKKLLLKRGFDAITNTGTLVPIEGYNPYIVISRKWGGLDPLSGDPIGFLNGKPSKSYDSIAQYSKITDFVYNGSNLPTIFGNLINTLAWEKIALSFNITYQFGFYFQRPALNYSNLFDRYIVHSEYNLRWQKPGDEIHTNVPSMVYPANPNRDAVYSQSEINIERGDHIRLEDIRLEYSVENKRKTNTAPKSLKIFCLVNNLNVLLWRKNEKWIDPLFTDGLRPSRQFSFGISATF